MFENPNYMLCNKTESNIVEICAILDSAYTQPITAVLTIEPDTTATG